MHCRRHGKLTVLTCKVQIRWWRAIAQSRAGTTPTPPALPTACMLLLHIKFFLLYYYYFLLFIVLILIFNFILLLVLVYTEHGSLHHHYYLFTINCFFRIFKRKENSYLICLLSNIVLSFQQESATYDTCIHRVIHSFNQYMYNNTKNIFQSSLFRCYI